MSKINAQREFELQNRYFYQRHRGLYKKDRFNNNHHNITLFDEYFLSKKSYYLELYRTKLNNRYNKKSEAEILDDMLQELFK